VFETMRKGIRDEEIIEEFKKSKNKTNA